MLFTIGPRLTLKGQQKLVPIITGCDIFLQQVESMFGSKKAN